MKTQFTYRELWILIGIVVGVVVFLILWIGKVDLDFSQYFSWVSLNVPQRFEDLLTENILFERVYSSLSR